MIRKLVEQEKGFNPVFDGNKIRTFYTVPHTGAALVDSVYLPDDKIGRVHDVVQIFKRNVARLEGTRGVWELVGPKGKRVLFWDDTLVTHGVNGFDLAKGRE